VLILNGLTIRDTLSFYTRNPKVTAREKKPSHYRIRVEDASCSAEDGNIYKFLGKKINVCDT